MIYLLDVNALLALGVLEHVFHDRAEAWVDKISKPQTFLATCAIVELGFIRILLQTYSSALTVADAQRQLRLLKSSSPVPFKFFADDQDAGQLPPWVHWPRQLTDGHLVALANAHGATLATLDTGIPGAFVIPH